MIRSKQAVINSEYAKMKSALVYSDSLQCYDFGPGHPFRGDRHADFMKLFMKEIGTSEDIAIVEPTPATDEDLALVHSPLYVDFVKEEASDPFTGTSWGYLDLDTPLSPGINTAARMVVGAGLKAGELVASGQYDVAVSVGGGMHHARPARGAGFCIFNDVAICIRHLQQRHGIGRILVIDTDGHAGDGTLEIFEEDPTVLVISIHQNPRTLYPGKGFASQIGQGAGKGFTVNFPLPPRTGIMPYLYAMQHIFSPLAREFKPQLILRNGGSDPHFNDQLVNLGITVQGFQRIGQVVREVAESVCEGKIIDMIGSGYNPEVLPYAWLALVSGVIGYPLDLCDPIPVPSWLSDDYGMEQVKGTVAAIKKHLSPFWECMQS